MRQRYRFYACPEDGCPKLTTIKGTSCPDPEHNGLMVEVILRREDNIDKANRMKQTADRLAKAGDKVAEARGQAKDPFGLADMFRGMADDVEHGRRRYTDEELAEDDDDNEDDK